MLSIKMVSSHALAYRSGKGIGVRLSSTLVTVNEALYVCSWFVAVFFLLAVAPLALAAGRRALDRSAIAIAVIQLVTTAASVDDLGQLSFTLWFLWIVFASIALARGKQARARATTVAAKRVTTRKTGEPQNAAAHRADRATRCNPDHASRRRIVGLGARRPNAAYKRDTVSVCRYCICFCSLCAIYFAARPNR